MTTCSAKLETNHIIEIVANPPTTVLANGTDEVMLTATVTVTDSNNTPVPNVAINWGQDITTHAVFHPASSITAADGSAITRLTNTSPELVSAIATTETSSTSILDVTFEMITVIPAFITLSANSLNVTPTVSTELTLTATVLDKNNMPVPDAVVTWNHTSTHATLAQNSSTTDAKGRAIVILKDTIAETFSLDASINVGSAVVTSNPLDVTFYPIPTNLTLSADRISTQANGANSCSLTATLTNSIGEPIPNAELNWATYIENFPGEQPKGASFSYPQYTNADGQVIAQVADTVPETFIVYAYMGPVGGGGVVPVSNHVTLTFTDVNAPGSIPAQLTMVTTQTSAPADGTTSITLTATVTDINNIPVPNALVHWMYTGSTNHTHIVQSAKFTDSEGKARLTLTNTIAETISIFVSTHYHNSLPLTITFR